MRLRAMTATLWLGAAACAAAADGRGEPLGAPIRPQDATLRVGQPSGLGRSRPRGPEPHAGGRLLLGGNARRKGWG